MKHTIYALALAVYFLFISGAARAQGFSFNTTGATAAPSAMMDISSTTKGVLVPRMTTAQRNAITSPATGLMIFQTDGTPGFYYYTGSAWSAVGGGGLPSGGTNGQVLTMVGSTPTWVSPMYYGIVATAGANGTISPLGQSVVVLGGSQVYTITANSGSLLTGVTVDGISVGAVTTYTFTSVSANHSISATFSAGPAVGSSYGGGTVAYYLQPGDPGYSSTVLHGLIASTSDLSTGIQWYNGTNTTTGATGTAIGTGRANTAAIVASQGAGSYAATLCTSYTGGGFTDWYLPSLDELDKLYINKTAIGGFASVPYWSSNEYLYSNTSASYEHFISGGQGSYYKYSTFNVRAVRAF